mmetsp:Transcript_41287/g.74089  ORF Transcript_41287/g.74089 Transcript_41287/m.74089 type:complete len:201 (+) Transcript_41287:330-932(+)
MPGDLRGIELEHQELDLPPLQKGLHPHQGRHLVPLDIQLEECHVLVNLVGQGCGADLDRPRGGGVDDAGHDAVVDEVHGARLVADGYVAELKVAADGACLLLEGLAPLESSGGRFVGNDPVALLRGPQGLLSIVGADFDHEGVFVGLRVPEREDRLEDVLCLHVEVVQHPGHDGGEIRGPRRWSEAGCGVPSSGAALAGP